MKKKIDIYLSILFVTLFFVLCFVLFYMQCIKYDSDMKVYIEDVKEFGKAICYPYPAFFVISYCFTCFMAVPTAIGITTAGFNTLSVGILAYYLYKYSFRDKKHSVLFSVLFSLSLHLISMLLTNGNIPGVRWIYLGVFSPNPYHNATYITARPFAIASFFLFYELTEKNVDKSDTKKMILFSAVLFVSTLSKPSFTLIFLAFCGIVMTFRLISNWKNERKYNLALCACFVPTIIDMLMQYSMAFTGNAEYQHVDADYQDMATSVITYAEENGNGIGVGLFNAWRLYCDNIPAAIVLASAFPIVYILLNFWRLKDKRKIKYAGLFFVIAVISFSFFYQKGLQFTHLNFSWGYMYGLFFFHTLCLTDMCSSITANMKKSEKVKIIISGVVFILHLISGVKYFYYLLLGGDYWI